MSSDESIDRVLAEVPEKDPPAAAIDDGVLLAYRRGLLSPEKNAEVEAMLARDPAARALLVELSKPIDPALVARLERTRAPKPRLWIAGAGVFAAAAALLVFAIVSPRPRSWPAYSLETEGFVSSTRGQQPGSSLLASDSQLQVRLRPDVTPKTNPLLSVWIAPGGGGGLERSQAGRLSSGEGAFHWTVEASSLFPRPGRYTIALQLASDSEDVAPNGLSIEEARRKYPGIGWWTIPVQYVTSAP